MFLIIQVILMFLSMGWSTIQMRHLIKNSQILKSGLYDALSVHDQGNAWHESYYHRKAHPRAALPNTSEDTNDQQTAWEPRCYNLVDCRHQSDEKRDEVSSSTHHKGTHTSLVREKGCQWTSSRSLPIWLWVLKQWREQVWWKWWDEGLPDWRHLQLTEFR